MNAAKIIDATGLSCPMPIIKTKKAIDSIESGEVIELHATDKGSTTDLKAWTESTGNKLVDAKEEDGVFKFWIQKA
ncbi:sulfurtransferase TusA family protein [Falsibacillus albus]|uniref:Sulfurtransferase TusA family protein n=1 Tax=Falsibacillus albus TaxID=2478915 RepID=A0A3L7K3X0_9BACI|nr:sulfurtransferase TusA family protein [Falsibacillus albus]RLQ96711.1 sulfurtransferase TusA family protein [Falsibacillus albus]